MATIIRVENLGKKYLIRHQQGDRYVALRDVLANKFKSFGKRLISLQPHSSTFQPSREEFWALKDMSFEVEQGDRVGIIGRNGAGKTTFLKLLSRITEPTTGRIVLKGRVASLLEVGTGFHPELTGRENIFLNGAILGMSRCEIKRKFDQIVDFAEIERFLDTPVKRYSSGMYVRLAFAVAAHLEPEILLVDEVLAVGDAAFQKKCLGKMEEVEKEGRTVLFVSHNMAAVNRLCRNTLWIDQGIVVTFGTTNSVIDRYLSALELEGGEYHNSSSESIPGDCRIRLLRVSIKNEDGEVAKAIGFDRPFYLEMEYEIPTRIDDVRLGYKLVAADGTVVFTSGDTDPEGLGLLREAGHYISRCTIPGNLLNSGRYYVSVACDSPMKEILLLKENILSFTIQLTGGAGRSVPDGRLGVIRLPLRWDIYRLR
jgi:lipopolysaccharide transport system ATP-binding protein